MTRRRGTTGPPRDYVRSEWPGGAPLPGAPRALELARAISVRLADALDGRSVTEVASRADLARSTLYDIVNGATWPDLVSLGKLSDALGIDLLPALPERDTVR